MGVEQDAEADAVDAGIVGDHGEILDPGFADRQDQRLGNAAQPEAAGHDQHAVLQDVGERRPRIGVDLLHETASPCCSTLVENRSRCNGCIGGDTGAATIERASSVPA